MSGHYHKKSLKDVEGLVFWKRKPIRKQPTSLKCARCGTLKVWYLTGLGTASAQCANCGAYQSDNPDSYCPYLQTKDAPDGVDFIYRYGIDGITVEVFDGLLCWVLWKEPEKS